MSSLTERGLTLRYLLALSVVALLSIASHFVLADTLKVSEGSAAVLNLSGRQRMLSQRIVDLALELERGDESARQPLKETIAQFSSAHDKLVGISGNGTHDRVAQARLHDTYFGAAKADGGTRAFIATAKRIAAMPVTAQDPRYSPDMAALTAAARGPLLDGLEQVVTIHQNASEQRMQRLQWIQWAILITVLATLALEGLFIFRPMVRSISGYVRQLLRLADHDYLTGVLNRRAFTEVAKTEMQRSRRHDRNLSILLVDADHFKRINDTHGHLLGDAVLVALAKTLDNVARREDTTGRIGGEEFALLLPETSLSEAGEVAERIRKAVAAHPIEAHGKTVNVTVSIGIASVPFDAADPLQAALATADSMLYKAKDNGRNCVWPKLSSVG